jgi:hypothetical protein
LHPNKLRNLLPSFAMEMSRSVDEVEAVTSFFYKTLRSKLSSLEHTVVHVQNLGNFYIKEKALDNNIQRYEKVLEKLGVGSLEEYGMKKKMRLELNQMVGIKSKLSDEKQRRRFIINKRFNNESEEKRNNNLEE